MTGSYYVRDRNRIILSAPEIILGNVDADGVLYEGSASKIIVRGTEVDLQATGNGGRVETRAASIRQIAEDPGTDGLEHVVGSLSEVISQARSIVIQSDDAQGAFAVPPTSNGGLRIHADKQLEISASQASERKEKLLDFQINGLEDRKSALQEQADDHKESFSSLISSRTNTISVLNTMRWELSMQRWRPLLRHWSRRPAAIPKCWPCSQRLTVC